MMSTVEVTAGHHDLRLVGIDYGSITAKEGG